MVDEVCVRSNGCLATRSEVVHDTDCDVLPRTTRSVEISWPDTKSPNVKPSSSLANLRGFEGPAGLVCDTAVARPRAAWGICWKRLSASALRRLSVRTIFTDRLGCRVLIMPDRAEKVKTTKQSSQYVDDGVRDDRSLPVFQLVSLHQSGTPREAQKWKNIPRGCLTARGSCGAANLLTPSRCGSFLST